jgi:hypothetical protein
MKKLLWVVLCIAILPGCGSPQRNWVLLENGAEIKNYTPFQKRLNRILTVYNFEKQYKKSAITYPYDNAVFPPEIAAPTITWEDINADVHDWLLIISFSDSANIFYALSKEREWQPDRNVWERIKENSKEAYATITILGLDKKGGEKIISKHSVSFSTSMDSVGASVFYRKVPLPFSSDFDKVKWCLGDISSYEKPKVVMEKLGVCASCHVFSSNGKYMSMEMNYLNDGGAQFIQKVAREIILVKKDFFSWNRFPRSGILPETRGLFGKMSPSGQYVVASVNEMSLALITNNPEFSQVFFPTYGILAYYSTRERAFKPLPGANDYAYVQANPNWRHDEKVIVYARAKTKNEVHDDINNVSPKFKDADIHELNQKYNIQFDLYTIPFNDGQGGTPIPLKGASNNGMSNYFARYSPDGKWIVFTQSKTGIMLQPDSQLFIVPSEGGTAKKMNCNRNRFNSWHSWSPNGKWLLFSSKVNTPFTEIFITHVDENGNDSPPVLLSRFSDSEYAANVPEFVNIKPDAIDKIRVE